MNMTHCNLEANTKFELSNTILRNAGIEYVDVDLEFRYLIMKTINGEYVETFIPSELTELPECIESNLRFLNFDEKSVLQIVSYFNELVNWPLSEVYF